MSLLHSGKAPDAATTRSTNVKALAQSCTSFDKIVCPILSTKMRSAWTMNSSHSGRHRIRWLTTDDRSATERLRSGAATTNASPVCSKSQFSEKPWCQHQTVSHHIHERFPARNAALSPPFASTAEPDLIRTEIGKMADRTAARTKPPAACW